MSDSLARAVGQRLKPGLGPASVSRTAAAPNHLLGAAKVARAAADGHRLMLGRRSRYLRDQSDALSQGQAALRHGERLRADHRADPHQPGAARAPALPASERGELIELAKQKPERVHLRHRRRRLRPQMNIVMFENMAGVKLRPVHYRGAAPALNDVIAGHIDLMSIGISSGRAAAPGASSRSRRRGAQARGALPDVRPCPKAAFQAMRRRPGSGCWHRGDAARRRDKINAEVQKISAIPRSAKNSWRRRCSKSMAHRSGYVRQLHRVRDAALGQGDPRALKMD